MLPLGPPDEHGSPYKSASAFAASPRLLAEPAAPVTACRARCDFRERAADWIEDWIAFAGRDALDDQVRFDREWRALRALRRRARREADRRHPDLRRRGLGRPARAPGDLQGRRRRRRAAGRVHRQGPAVGQPAVRLAGAAAAGLRVVDRALQARLRALRPRPDRPLPRRSRPTGRCPPTPSTRCEGTWKRGPGRAPFDAAPRGAGRAAADRRGPRRDHAAGHAAAASRSGCRGCRCCSSASRPSERHTAHVPENNSENQVVYTGTHDNDTIRGWYESLTAGQHALRRRGARALRHRGPEPHWALIRLAFASPARDRDDPDPGRARARRRRAG